MKPAWQGNKLQLHGVTIAEVKPFLEGTYRVAYVEKPDLGPSQLGYLDAAAAKAACEKRFGLV